MSTNEPVLNNNEQIQSDNKVDINNDTQEVKTAGFKNKKIEKSKSIQGDVQNKKSFLVKLSLILTLIFDFILMIYVLFDGCVFFNKKLNVWTILDIALTIFNISRATVFKSLSSIVVTIIYLIVLVKSIKLFIQSIKSSLDKSNSQFDNFKSVFSKNNLQMLNYMFLIIVSLAIKKANLTETNIALLIMFLILQLYNLIVYVLKSDIVKNNKILYVLQHLIINLCMFSVLICLTNGILSRVWEGSRSLFYGNININGGVRLFIYLLFYNVILPYIEFFISIIMLKVICNSIPSFEINEDYMKRGLKYFMVAMIVICLSYFVLNTILLRQGGIKIKGNILLDWIHSLKGTYLSGLLASIGLFILSYETEFIPGKAKTKQF